MHSSIQELSFTTSLADRLALAEELVERREVSWPSDSGTLFNVDAQAAMHWGARYITLLMKAGVAPRLRRNGRRAAHELVESSVSREVAWDCRFPETPRKPYCDIASPRTRV